MPHEGADGDAVGMTATNPRSHAPHGGDSHTRWAGARARPVPAAVAVGKAVRVLTRLRGGGGSTMPGWVVERLFPRALRHLLAQLPGGVVLVTGTNGKTTTTKVLAELLRGQGLRVVTNPSGSNFVRGVASAMVDQADASGRLRADMAVVELDEAHAVEFVRQAPPRCVVLLNVVRDQLDRFAEPDGVTELLVTVAASATDVVVLNDDDPRLRDLPPRLAGHRVVTFGAAPALRSAQPRDRIARPQPAVVLRALTDGPHGEVAFDIAGELLQTRWRLRGVHNALNVAAALATLGAVLDGAPDRQALATSLQQVAPAFGRGESVTIDGQPVVVVLVKNPCGFQAALRAYARPGSASLIAVNDAHADSRDTSWLWDVDFTGLREHGPVQTAGSRAYDAALRLAHDGVLVADATDDIADALRSFVVRNRTAPMLIYCTYTAMLEIRACLGATRRVEGRLG